MGDAFVAAVLTKGDDVRGRAPGRKFRSTQRTALQWQNPICARKGCANRLGLEYDHFEDWATTHTTRVEAAKRFCHPCHQLKSRGWRVSEPDEHGECTFTPPDLKAVPTPPPPPCKPDAAGPEPPDPHPHSPTPGSSRGRQGADRDHGRLTRTPGGAARKSPV